MQIATVVAVNVSRRAFLRAGAGGALTKAALPFSLRDEASRAAREFRLVAAPVRAPLFGAGRPETAVWSYSGRIPRPEIRVRQGDRLRIFVENRLPEDTSAPWQGVRVPNAMDGVPFLTQSRIGHGETFRYEFDGPDAGCARAVPEPQAPTRYRAGHGGHGRLYDPLPYPRSHVSRADGRDPCGLKQRRGR